MTHPLFKEINKFEAWAKNQLLEPSKISAEWEADYPDWSTIDEQFKAFIGSYPPSTWSTEQVAQLSYIIARDIEDGRLMEALSDDALVFLAEYALIHGEWNNRWQIALVLPRLADQKMAISLIERYTNDPDAHVRRIALHALAAARDGRRVTYDDLKA